MLLVCSWFLACVKIQLIKPVKGKGEKIYSLFTFHSSQFFVVFPAPANEPRHSPRFNSKLTSFTAENSSGRSPPFPPWRLPSISLPRSCMPYHNDFLRLRQDLLETLSTLIKVSDIKAVKSEG